MSEVRSSAVTDTSQHIINTAHGFYKTYTTPILIGVGIIIGIIIILILNSLFPSWTWGTESMTSMPLVYYDAENFYVPELPSNALEQKKLLLFYSPHCHWCTEFMNSDAWKKFITNNSSVQVDIINASDKKNHDLVKQYSVYDTPTLLCVTGSNVHKYSGNNSYDSLLEFVSTNNKTY